MKLIRMPNEDQERLVIITEKHKMCVLRWDAESMQCQVISSGDLQDHLVLNTQHRRSRIGIVDPNARCIGLHQFQHLFKVIPTRLATDTTAFNVRLPEEKVEDMAFLYGCAKPTVALLYRRDCDSVHLRTYEISLADQDMSLGGWGRSDLEATVSKLIAVPEPFGGVIAVGDDSVTYYSRAGDCVNATMNVCMITAIGQIDSDGTRFLLGDHRGQLMMLVLDVDREKKKVYHLRLETLGVTSVPSSISYLDNSYVYIGSDMGDSQLIKLSETRNLETKSYLEVALTHTNLGPIIDFCIIKGMGYLRQGQGQVVTCSGVAKDGSLRVIRNGIGISEQASVELPGIKDIFSLRRHFGDRYHSYLMQSFASETRILGLKGEQDMVEFNLHGFDQSSPTLHASNMEGDLLVQVTAKGVYVLDCATMLGGKTAAWTPPEGFRISVATGNATQLLLATTGGNLIYLVVEPHLKKTVVEQAHTKLDNEIACVNCNPLGAVTEDEMGGTTGPLHAKVAVVGLWAEANQSPVAQVIALPSLSVVHTVELGGDVMARSILLATLEGFDYLLVALGDGYLLTFAFNAAMAGAVAGAGRTANSVVTADVVSERRRLSVGTQPANLSIFRSRGSNHVFAACDRPTVVYATGAGKLLVSNVNLEEVTRVCGFDTEAFPDCLAIATEGKLHLGVVDEIQKLHITPIPLDEQPRRIAHLEAARAFAVLTATTLLDETGEEASESYVRLIDDSTYDTTSRFKLQPTETGLSILATSFTGEGLDSSTEYLVVGTVYELPNEEDPSSGRILIFRIIDSRIVLVAEQAVNGAVYSLCSFNGKLLAGVNAFVIGYSFSERTDGVFSIIEEGRHVGHIMVFRLQARGNFVLVADLLRSVTVLTCKTDGRIQLEELARDPDPTWLMAIEMLDDDMYIAADQGKHLFTFRRNSHAPTEVERMRLERVGQFHLGSAVNRIQHGSLVMQMPENESPALKTLIFGTVDGMVGVIATLKADAFKFFSEVQTAVTSVLPSVGGLRHSDWREVCMDNPQRTAVAKNFLDGDVIERFLDLPERDMAKVSTMVNVGVEEIVRRVEDMQRLHGAG